MTSYKKGAEGEAFLVAFTDACRDTEGIKGMTLYWDFHLTPRRGVICIHGEARYTASPTARGATAASIEGEYPNSRAGSLEAFLYGLAFKLGGMAAAWYDSEQALRRK